MTNNDKVELFTTIRDLHIHFLSLLDKDELKLLQQSLSLLNKCPIRFQMEECGPFLLKDAKPHYYSHPDVPFIPDEWQKNVLNHINLNKSCLIVAPTSSGKSFISFYTISHVLKLHNNDSDTNSKWKGKKEKKEKKEKPKEKPKEKAPTTNNNNNNNTIKVSKSMQSKIVFVAPTIPLCNQMVAMVYERYKQNVKVGVFAADFRIKVKTCQVLVCTPLILEILLMSPACEEWRLGLEYVILDEIHFTNAHKSNITVSADGGTFSHSLLSAHFFNSNHF